VKILIVLILHVLKYVMTDKITMLMVQQIVRMMIVKHLKMAI